ncbi:MAG: response regulator [Mariprofundales bacterium]
MSKKLMIIDDEPEVRSVLGEFSELYCQDKGVDCDIVLHGNPVEALFGLTGDGDDYMAILLDIRMPKMGGDDIFRAILAMDASMADRVLFVTGFAKDVEACYPERDLNVLLKPFTFQAFAQAMDRVLQRGV